MSVGCGAEGGHEEPELGEAGGPGVDGVHKGAFSPRLWPPTQPRSPSGGGGGGGASPARFLANRSRTFLN